MGTQYIPTLIHLNTGAEKGGVCSLHRGRLMSRWVSSKLTSVSDRASPGQAFYHDHQSYALPVKHIKKQTVKQPPKPKTEDLKRIRLLPRCTLQPTPHSRVISMISVLRTAEVYAVDLAVCFYLQQYFLPFMNSQSRGARINIAKTHNYNPSYSSSWLLSWLL